jgi:vacuolar-type H+-ATPase subunit I/STV1
MERVQTIMSFVIPVQFAYNNKNYAAQMGPFNHSTEREFALTVNRRAIDDCTSIEQLKPVAKNLLEGWASMQTAVQSLMLENIQLRQALAKRDVDLHAAEEIITEASKVIDTMRRQSARGQQSTSARRGLWPW